MKETELLQAFEKMCLAFAEMQAKYEQVERENTQLKTTLAEALEREAQAVAEKIQLQDLAPFLASELKRQNLQDIYLPIWNAFKQQKREVHL